MIKLTETKKVQGSMAPTWDGVMSEEDELRVENEATVRKMEMGTEARKVYALEKIADLLELFVKMELKKFDPDIELVIETVPVEEEYEEDENSPIYDEEIEEGELPVTPRPENFDDEITTEIYVKDIIRPHLTDAVLEKVEVSVGEDVIKLKLPWLNNDTSYREGMEWRDMAANLRTNGFEWVSEGKNSHWKAET